ncbi:MAG: phosphoribosylglycinamide formyltransferase [Zetaproteobacteria bacterium]|nr:MAG: phosphoribosylglycinamide formyltransferase [Zetaproteobacteria bacterium]
MLASGRGSNLQAILEACADGRCPARVALVLSDHADAGALAIARTAGVARVLHLDPAGYPDRAAYDVACAEEITAAGCHWVVLAGYMRILSGGFVRRFRNRIVNIHPALLPAFPGAHGVEDALRYGVKVSGCTVHLVDEQIDNGPILAQAAVPVADDDDATRLRARIQQQEHRIYPETLARMMEQGFDLVGRRVVWRGGGG